MWLKDPITKSESVPVTLLTVACVLMIVFIFVECFTDMKSTHLLDEFFGACMALYGNHMWTAPKNDPGPTVTVSTAIKDIEGKVGL